jgi:replicative DNA helicase
MGPDPMALRLACDVSRDRFGNWSDDLITLERINRGDLSDREWQILDGARQEVAKWPIRFDTRPGHTMARIESLSRRAFRDFERRGVKPGLIIVDHRGKVRPGSDRRGNKHAEVADISGAAAEMAKRLDVPVLLLCQLNRQVEGRPDKQPTLSDLRQAGEIEEDARQVIFLSRPEYYLREPGADESIADRMEREDKLAKVRNKLFWIVAKNSNGPTGTALTRCDISASAVREWTDR